VSPTDRTTAGDPAPAAAGPRHRLPAGVWVLGGGSLLMDLSSEMIHSLLPLLLAGPLGASLALVGLIEGTAEALASLVKGVSGGWSDRLGRRKPLLVAGYGLAALAKPVFPLAGSAVWVLAARCVDRLGKGLRGAPRDALVADLTPAAVRGAAYGLRQALDSVGALLGPLAAMLGMAWLDGDLRAVMGWAVLPAAGAVALLALLVREPAGKAAAGRGAWRLAEVRRLPAACRRVTVLAALVGVARCSEAFLVLRGHGLGLAPATAPLVMVVLNVVYAGLAWPAGRAADRRNRRLLLGAGLAVLAAAHLLLAVAETPALALAGAAAWGLHLALTQGLLSAMVVAPAPPHLRGTAFGLFHLATGLATLAASLLAGSLWSAVGPRAAFLAGAAAALAALAALPLATAPSAGQVLRRRRGLERR